MMGISRPVSGSTAMLADQRLVARVIGMHRHRGVAQHGFGPGGGDGDELVAVLDRIFDVPEMALDLDVLDFQVATPPSAAADPS